MCAAYLKFSPVPNPTPRGKDWSVEQNYYRILIRNLPPELEDAATELCFAYDCAGVSETLSFEQNDAKYLPKVKPTETIDLEAYFYTAPSPDIIHALEKLSPTAKVETTTEENKDWLHEWKKGFEPFALVGSIWVVPSWCEAPDEATTSLLIDPGMAFGTGTHETTKLASQLITEFFGERPETESVLDVGTGTGILALLAHHLGAKQVVGLEIDELARGVARENVELNGVNSIQIPEHQIEDEQGHYQLVIANVIDGVLLELRADLCRCMAVGGDLILSGILTERLEAFLSGFVEGTSLQLHKRLSLGEWEGLWFKSPGAN